MKLKLPDCNRMSSAVEHRDKATGKPILYYALNACRASNTCRRLVWRVCLEVIDCGQSKQLPYFIITHWACGTARSTCCCSSVFAHEKHEGASARVAFFSFCYSHEKKWMLLGSFGLNMRSSSISYEITKREGVFKPSLVVQCRLQVALRHASTAPKCYLLHHRCTL